MMRKPRLTLHGRHLRFPQLRRGRPQDGHRERRAKRGAPRRLIVSAARATWPLELRVVRRFWLRLLLTALMFGSLVGGTVAIQTTHWVWALELYAVAFFFMCVAFGKRKRRRHLPSTF